MQGVPEQQTREIIKVAEAKGVGPALFRKLTVAGTLQQRMLAMILPASPLPLKASLPVELNRLSVSLRRKSRQ